MLNLMARTWVEKMATGIVKMDVVVEEVNKEEAEENSQVAQEEVDSIKETTAKSRVSTLLNQVDASEQTVDNTIRQALTIPSHRNIRSHASGEPSASI